MKQTLTVPKGAAVGRLDVYLTQALALSRSQVQKLIRQERITLDDKVARANHTLEGGEVITADIPVPVGPVTFAAPDLPIIYEDDDIIVIDKPAGLAVHPGAGVTPAATVADFAREHSVDLDPERPGIVHRLDRNTSGLMIIAKTPAAKANLQKKFKNREVSKTYILLAVGRLSPEEAIIRLPLDRDPAHPLRRAVVATGRPAITAYHALAYFPGYTLVEAAPETGRTHQIRVHFAALGHPVAGDAIYGSPLKTLHLDRHFLHAKRLEFNAPSGKHLSLTSELPRKLQAVIESLEKQV